MKPDNSIPWLQAIRNGMVSVLLSVLAIGLLWQSPFGFNTSAMAAPAPLFATSDVKNAADDVRDQSKDLIRDAKRNVEKAANRNAQKVDQADQSGGVFEQKAQRDRNRIMERAEEDASRTENAVDKSMNAVKGLVDNVKDAFD